MVIEPSFLYLLAGTSVLLGMVCGWGISRWLRLRALASRLELRTRLQREELALSAAWLHDDENWLRHHGMELESDGS